MVCVKGSIIYASIILTKLYFKTYNDDGDDSNINKNVYTMMMKALKMFLPSSKKRQNYTVDRKMLNVSSIWKINGCILHTQTANEERIKIDSGIDKMPKFGEPH